MNSVKVADLAPFAPCTVNIRGRVTYSHIASHIDGEELAKMNKRRMANGQTADTKPYTTITITNAQILDTDKLNPLVTQYFMDKIWDKQNDDGTISKNYTARSRSPYLPNVAYGKEAGTDLAGQGIADRDVKLEHELAVGLDVTVGVKLFRTNGSVPVPVGIGIDYVLVNEPIRYYTSPGIAAALASQGITNYRPPVNTRPETHEVPQQTTEQNAQPVSVNPMSGVGSPSPMAQPIQPEPQAPAYTQQVQQMPPQQAQAQMQQAAASPMVGMPAGGAAYGQQGAGQTPPPTLQYNPM